MNDNTCRAAAWAGHVDQGHVTGVTKQVFPDPFISASRPDLVNIFGGLCWYLDEVQSSASPGPDLADDAWCWGNDNEEVASSLETCHNHQIGENWAKMDFSWWDIYTIAMPRLKISTWMHGVNPLLVEMTKPADARCYPTSRPYKGSRNPTEHLAAAPSSSLLSLRGPNWILANWNRTN